MEEYAHRKNIERFEQDLASETDADRRRLIEGLLERERNRLTAVLEEKARQPRPTA